LSKVGLSRSRERNTQTAKDESYEEVGKMVRSNEKNERTNSVNRPKQIFGKTVEEICEMTIGSKISKRSQDRVVPLRTDKYIHSNIKDLITDKL